MATRRRVKKDIKKDQLVTFTVRLSQWTQEHFNQVIIGVVVLVAVIAISVFMANSRQGSSKRAAAQMSSAMTLMQTGDYEAARGSFAQIEQEFGGKKGTLAAFFAGECDYRQKKYADAIASYDQYLHNYEKYPLFRGSALYAKADCQAGLGNYADAAATLVSLLGVVDSNDPRYLDAAYQAGEFFAKAGDKEQAAKYFGEVAAKASGDLQSKASVAATLLSN
jgi:TolA-binding protein